MSLPTDAVETLAGTAVIPAWLLVDQGVSPGSKFVYLYLSAIWPGVPVDVHTAEVAQAIPDLFKDLAGPGEDPTDDQVREFAEACDKRFRRWLDELERAGVVTSEPLPPDPDPLRVGHRVAFSLYRQTSR